MIIYLYFAVPIYVLLHKVANFKLLLFIMEYIILINLFYILTLFDIRIQAKCSENKDEPFSIKCNGYQTYLNLDKNSSVNKIQYENLNAPVLPLVKTYGKVNTFICSQCGLEILYQSDFEYMKHLLYLDLSHNNITVLEPVFDHVNKLDVLNLRGNKIKHLSRRIFADIQELSVLDLSENQIEDLRNATFVLPGLSTLILSDNLITDIDDNSFLGLKLLTDLHLARNKIFDLSPDCFRHTNHLLFLDLSNNKLDEIQLKTFSNLNKLQFLYLNGNSIRSLPKRLFYQLYELLYLDISGNNLSRLSDNLFKNNKYLTSINLGYNKISEISSSSFQGLVSLKQLYLQHNAIYELNNSAFEHLTSLNILNLAFNNIQSISKKAFKGLDNLNVLVLTGNPISIQDIPTLPNGIGDIYVHHCSEHKSYISQYFDDYYNLKRLYCVEDIWVERLNGLVVHISADSGQALDSAESNKTLKSRFYANVLVN